MSKKMTTIDEVRTRARTSFDRNWRDWAIASFVDEPACPTFSVSLHPPRETDLEDSGRLSEARAWVSCWRECTLPGIEWQSKSWSRVGNQTLPVRVKLESIDEIARWADRQSLWKTALKRVADMRGSAPSTPSTNRAQSESGEHNALRKAIRTSIGDWCALSEDDWATALLVWRWLFAHPNETRFVRQLPIRGIDTKWIEQHGKTLRAWYRAISGADYTFAQPSRQFRCKSCSPETQLGGCVDFSVSAPQIAALSSQPDIVIISENLVNTLCLDKLPRTLAIHGSGFAVTELHVIPWLADIPILYWGDLDSNGFAILNALRSFAPHTRSIMMDESTLHRHFDLCVNEPKPANGTFERLTSSERNTLYTLAQGDPSRAIEKLRLEQERIEWGWAYNRIEKAVEQCSG